MLMLTNVGEKGSHYLQQKLAEHTNWTPSSPIAAALAEAQVVSSGFTYAVAETKSDGDLYVLGFTQLALKRWSGSANTAE